MSSIANCFQRALARSRHVAVVALVAVALCATAASALAAKVNIVSQGEPPSGKIPANTHYFTTIQAAVNASTAGDYVLIEPGVYDEEVKVTSAQSGIWIRGMNRNTVIVDGQHKAGNGIEIHKANDVWVENLTVRNFDQSKSCGDESCGNEIWWNGGAESGKIGAHGWYGAYLTAYDTGFLTVATAYSRTTRSKAPGKTSTPPVSTTRACTSAPARNARRVSRKRRWKTTRSATRARTRAAAW